MLPPATLPRASKPTAGIHINRTRPSQSTPSSFLGNHGRTTSSSKQPIQIKPKTKADARAIIQKIAIKVDLNKLREKGEGNPDDFLKAMLCYLKAVTTSQGGHAHAHLCVGDLYATAVEGDVLRDKFQAFGWYLKAASLGDAHAQSRIAQLKASIGRSRPAGKSTNLKKHKKLPKILDTKQALVESNKNSIPARIGESNIISTMSSILLFITDNKDNILMEPAQFDHDNAEKRFTRWHTV
ncbi:hypothetical protein BGZ95_000098, partial [Linnemannia exigua]